MAITSPSLSSETYNVALDADLEDAAPKIGTTVQKGWDALDKMGTNASPDYPTDFKFSEDTQLIKFLDDEPIAVYEQHWIDNAPKQKSFVCLGDECPLCNLLGDKPRGKFVFNVLVLSGDTPVTQVLTAAPTLARQLRKAADDERRGPLGKEFWEVSRSGQGPQTSYSLNYVRGRDLAEEWKLDLDTVNATASSAKKFTAAQVVRETPRSELLELARSLA